MNASIRQPAAPGAVHTEAKGVLPTRSAKLRRMLQSPKLDTLTSADIDRRPACFGRFLA